MNISVSFVSRWETGRAQINLKRLIDSLAVGGYVLLCNLYIYSSNVVIKSSWSEKPEYVIFI